MNNIHALFMSMDLGRFGDIAATSYMSEELIKRIKANYKLFTIVYNDSITMEQ